MDRANSLDDKAPPPFDVAEERENRRERLAGEIAEHQYRDDGFLEFVRSEIKAEELTPPGAAGPNRADSDDEEEKKRGRSVGGATQIHAQLGANVRPDVVDAPGGLQVITTQKSADYRPDLVKKPDRDAGDDEIDPGAEAMDYDYVATELAAADRDEASRQSLEQEQLDGKHAAPDRAERQRDGVDIPIIQISDITDAAPWAAHLNPDTWGPDSTTSARDRDFREHQQGDAPGNVANDPAELTIETIQADPWNAVALPLPMDAPYDLLVATAAAAEWCLVGDQALMFAARDGDYEPPGFSYEMDIHEHNEGKMLDAMSRFNTIVDRLEQLEPLQEAIARQAEQESTQRQDNERRARAGEDVAPGAEAMDYVASELRAADKEARIERDTEYDQAKDTTPGTDRSPRGGGRDIF